MFLSPQGFLTRFKQSLCCCAQSQMRNVLRDKKLQIIFTTYLEYFTTRVYDVGTFTSQCLSPLLEMMMILCVCKSFTIKVINKVKGRKVKRLIQFSFRT